MRFIINQFVQLFSNLSDLLEVIFRIPFRALGFSHSQGDEDQRGIVMRVLTGLGKLLLMPFVLIAGAIMLPVRAMTVFPPERRRDFLLGVPSVLVLLVIFTAALRTPIRAENINNKYRGLAKQALTDGNFERAATYWGRIVNSTSDPGENDLYSWAISLSQTGDDRAFGIINRLAPDDASGMQAAHELKAINLAANLENNSDPAKLKTLKHHLDQCSSIDSYRLYVARGAYYLGIGEKEKAVFNLESAAKINAGLYLELALIHEKNGDEFQRKKAFQNARLAFQNRLDAEPFDNVSRIILARILTTTDQLDDAEKLLKEGLLLNDERNLREAMSGFLVNKYDRTEESLEFNRRLEMLHSALQFSVNNTEVYERLGKAHLQFEPEKIVEVKSLLIQAIAEGENAALAHFTLSSILWQEGEKEQAFWHVEQAYRIMPGYIFVANNLAYMLAVGEHKDLERALELATEVVSHSADPRFRDTLGTVYFEMGDYEKALGEFQQALSAGLSGNAMTHEKLFRIYSDLGQSELAEIHRRKSVDLLESASTQSE